MGTLTNNDLLECLRIYHLLHSEQFDEAAHLQSSFGDARLFAGELLQRGLLTPYQINQIFRGRARELLLGSYVLLEKLGEGGMGAVFKARNWKLGQIVALKLIRKERLDSESAVQRFQREIRAAAQLNHPHIVRAIDADREGTTHFFVMEYAEGTDLARLVKQNGSLSVRHACEYLRQAALGLQHAFERGLVHRDIKPGNLLLTERGTVKILDMGLARIEYASEEDKTSTLTQEGSVMGTPDYIAPEQALDSHRVDIRADLYSLGCVLYFLLAKRVPFPGGTMMEKLLKHRLEQPTPIQQLRPDVSDVLAAILNRLMAKTPEERYQTPAELVAVLDSLPLFGSAPGIAVAEPDTVSMTEPPLRPIIQRQDPTALIEKRSFLIPHALDRRWPRIAIPASGLMVLLLVVTSLLWSRGFFTPEKKPGTEAEVVESPPKPVPLPKIKPSEEFENWKKSVISLPPKEQVVAVAKKLMELNPEFDGRVTPTIRDGQVTELKFLTEFVTDISPVQALPNLTSLSCSGNYSRRGKLTDLTPLAGMKLTKLDCQLTKVKHLYPIKGMKLDSLNCNLTLIGDLTPLKGMKLQSLNLNQTQVVDLTPLKDVELTELICSNTKINNLAPLTGSGLKVLHCGYSPIKDLTPLKETELDVLSFPGTHVETLAPLEGLNLSELNFQRTKVSDLTPLEGMKLVKLVCNATQVTNLTPLKGMPLKELQCDFVPARDTDILKRLKTLEYINGLKVADFWKKVEADPKNPPVPVADNPDDEFGKWKLYVASLPAKEQVDAVVKKLLELNPEFENKFTPTIKDGQVKGLGLYVDGITDLSPLQAFPELTVLNCVGTKGEKGKLTDLSPLQGTKLTSFFIRGTPVKDLTPLKHMKLTYLFCGGNKITDLTPLKGMPLTEFDCIYSQIKHLTPLEGMNLTKVNCSNSFVEDLTPLKGMMLKELRCGATRIKNLNPLKGMPLTFLNIGGTQIKDLSPLNGMNLTYLGISASWVEDLTPLQDLKVKELNCHASRIKDLAPLKNLELTFLRIDSTQIADLSPLKNMKLANFLCRKTKVTDLSPLKDMPLKELHCDFVPARDTPILKGIKTLEKINDLPLAEFWKMAEADLKKQP